jgi:hypothetical protein
MTAAAAEPLGVSGRRHSVDLINENNGRSQGGCSSKYARQASLTFTYNSIQNDVIQETQKIHNLDQKRQ